MHCGLYSLISRCSRWCSLPPHFLVFALTSRQTPAQPWGLLQAGHTPAPQRYRLYSPYPDLERKNPDQEWTHSLHVSHPDQDFKVEEKPLARWSSSFGHLPPSHHFLLRISKRFSSCSLRMARSNSSRYTDPGGEEGGKESEINPHF